jgi:hypothetical protein
MAESKQDAKKGTGPGAKEAQKAADAQDEKGYIGETADPLPNKEHSLQSGPDAPTAEEQREAVAKARK